jgi:PKD repeat protein
MKRTLLTFLSLCFLLNLSAQTEYMVLLHSGEQIWAENARNYSDQAFISSHEAIEGKYYRFLQFFEIPNQEGLDKLSQEGIELLEYIPNKAYIASIPVAFDVNKLPDMGVRSIMPIIKELKMRYDLTQETLPVWAVKGNRIELMLKYYKNIRHEAILDYCKNDGIKILAENGYNNALKISIPKDKLEILASMPYVAFIEPIPQAGEKEDVEGRTLHRANLLDTNTPSGRHYDGEGIGVVCRDDGAVGPHIDFQGRIDQEFVGPYRGTHGDGVSGIMAGAGNLNPRNRGMASAADLWILDYEDHFLDETMDLFFNHNAIITNSSYSNGCNAGYTVITETVDGQLWNNQTLLHVFSAGNSNNNNCGYGAGNQWGNITGGHKQAKNCIATANLFADASLVNSSSRGPAHDGRLKPDIAANGQDQISTSTSNTYQSFGGTSGAAPGIAGIAAMLQDAHRELNNDDLAPAPLIKAILMNSANDLGNKGPDYKYGWGHVNAFRGALTLEENRYLTAEVMPGETNMHTITIPDGVVQSRVMVYWADPQSTVMTNKALVNDIDIKMVDASGTEYLPWLLDPTPDPIILDTPAGNGNDHLNNVEQVAIDNPVPGDYTLEVNGFELPFGAKEYFIVWEFRTSEITVIYPNGGDKMVPGEMERVHWDAEGDSGDFQVSASVDGGANWDLIEAVFGDQRMAMWEVPDVVSGDVIVRVSRGQEIDVSDAPSTIMKLPSAVKVDHACPEYIRVVWSPVENATSYDVHLLGQKFMEEIGNTVDTFFDVPTINMNPSLDHWFAVSANEDNIEANGRRTIAKHWDGGLLDCDELINEVGIQSLDSPGSDILLGCDVIDYPVAITLINNGNSSQTGFEVGYEFNGQTPVIETFTGILMPGETGVHTFSSNINITLDGDYSINSWVNLANDEGAFNNNVSRDMQVAIASGQGAILDYLEDFDASNMLPNFYTIYNPDNSNTWQITPSNVTGINGMDSRAILMRNRFYGLPGEKDEFITEPINFTDQSAVLTFDLAYRGRPTNSGTLFDGLQVWISTDCGFSFPYLIYDKSGQELGTTNNTSFQYPQMNDWMTQVAPIPASADGQSIVIKFVNITNGGENLYIDNINIQQIIAPAAIIDATKEEVCKGKFVVFNAASTGSFVTHEWNFGTNASPSTGSGDGPHFVLFSQVGIQPVELIATNGVSSDTTILNINVIEDDPTADFTFDINNGTVNFTNTSVGGSEFLWNFGDGNSSTEENPSYAYSEVGQFTVTLFVENDCGDANTTQVFDIMVGTNELNLNFSADILPNPTSGLFQVDLVSSESEDLTIELLDLRGILIQKEIIKVGNFKTTQTFDATHLASGVYFVKIIGAEGYMTKRIVVD